MGSSKDVRLRAGEPRTWLRGLQANPLHWKQACSLSSALLYGTVAVAMNFVNKYQLMVFPLPSVVLLLQMCATLAVLHPLLLAGTLGFPRFTLRRARQLAPISLMYTLNTAFALFGLKSLNIPMYNTLKRLTPMIVLATKSIMRRSWPAGDVLASVSLVVAGCIIAGLGDLAFDLAGYAYALASCSSQAAYLLLVEAQGQQDPGGAGGSGGSAESAELLYYNAATSLPLLAAMALASGEAAKVAQAAATGVLAAAGSWTLFGAVMAASSLMGCLLNYSLFLCTVNNSALTTTIVGVLKGVVAVALGFFLLGGVAVSGVNVTGIGLNTIGGVWYTYIKFVDSKRRKTVSGGEAAAAGGDDTSTAYSAFGADAMEAAPLLAAEPLKGASAAGLAAVVARPADLEPPPSAPSIGTQQPAAVPSGAVGMQASLSMATHRSAASGAGAGASSPRSGATQ